MSVLFSWEDLASGESVDDSLSGGDDDIAPQVDDDISPQVDDDVVPQVDDDVPLNGNDDIVTVGENVAPDRDKVDDVDGIIPNDVVHNVNVLPRTTRGGRSVRLPSHLKDYVV